MLRSALALLLGGGVLAADLLAGPMAGPPTHRGVTLWLQADGAARASVEYWPLSAPKTRRRSEVHPLVAAEDFSGKITLFGLEPGERYGYRVLFDGKPVGKELQFATQELWQWRRDAPDFKVVAGSCNYGNEPPFDRPGKPYGDRHLTIFPRMAEQKPDLTLWLGDNVYYREVDYSSPEGMAYRWKRERAQGYMQSIFQVGGHAAIWDDHDYGPDNANRSFVFKGEALKLQQRYWPNPSFGLPETNGAFTAFSFNDVDFFLLDNRTYRDDPDMPAAADKAMFGPEQMRWLKNALLGSRAAFKVVVGGSLFLRDDERADDWNQYPNERENFLDWMHKAKVEGVFFMSGDVHRAQLSKIDRRGAYPLYDLTCSPLTSGGHNDPKLAQQPELVSGTLVLGERSFCSLEFQGKKAERRVVMKVINADGEVKWEKALTRAELRYKSND